MKNVKSKLRIVKEKDDFHDVVWSLKTETSTIGRYLSLAEAKRIKNIIDNQIPGTLDSTVTK